MDQTGSEEDLAFALADGVPYVRRWGEACHAAEALRGELGACGLARRVPHLRAEVTVAGIGVVELGRVTPATAERLAELLAVARRNGGGRAA